MKVCPVCATEYGEEAAFCSRDRSPLRTADAHELPGLLGQLVGERYQVERRLGEGGMGEVYLARHVLIGRPCALKVMSPALSKDPDAVSRFNREATSASRIAHPNVCAVYDFGLTPEGLVYLAMEYVEGRTLSALLDEAGPLPVDRAAALVAQCAAGLMAAHELGIVHRDLKPDNIMVLTGRERETAKLVDFGIAKAMESLPGERVTKSGFVVGTPEYMSPEQLAGDPVDGRSDQYSLALVFYRLITGTLPFEGNSLQETLVKRLTDPPRPLRESRPDAVFPPGLQPVVDRALARDPELRYPSVGVFSEAIQAELQGEQAPTRRLPLESRGGVIPATRQARAPRAGRRSRVAVAAIGVLLLGGSLWAMLKGDRAPSSATRGDTAQAMLPAPRLDTAPRGTQATGSAVVPPSALPARQPARATPDTGRLDLGALESPTRRARELERAERQLLMPELTAERKAEAAALLGNAALEAGRPDSARVLYRMAWRLSRKPSYLETLRQLGDTIQS
ncbi:MAG TPA: serine/threonine-protein kinase [Gemmatimonadales bacterium]|nr:serine/threonine-protein kinase [Gemmatimonadales bacterium]